MTYAPDRIIGTVTAMVAENPSADLLGKALLHAAAKLREIMDDPCTNPDGNAERAWDALAETAEILDEWRVPRG